MLRANITSHGRYEGVDLVLLQGCVAVLENTINSDRFKQAVLGFQDFHFDTYKCVYTLKRKRIKGKVYTNAEVLERILQGAAAMAPIPTWI